MQRLGSIVTAFTAGLAIFGAGTVLAADKTAVPNAPAHMDMTDDGPVLVTPSGMALYTSSNEDTKSDKFKPQCTNVANKGTNDEQSGVGLRPVIGAQFAKSCAEKFPPYLADANAQPIGDFSIYNRPEGGAQWSYRGFPLYTSVKDHSPGEHNGAALGGFGGGRRGGMVLAMVPMDLPMGLKFSHRDEGLVLATAGNGDRPVYTPHGVRLSKICAGCDEEAFQPLLAPAVASVSGDWSIIDAGAGRKQYAFKGQPLYAAPPGMADWEIAYAGGWEMVVYQKSPGRPSEIGEHLTLITQAFTDKAGHTLYTYNCNSGVGGYTGVSCDDAGDAAGFMVADCGLAAECARRWHPYMASDNAKPLGDWSVVEITYPMFTDPRGMLYPPDAPHVKVWAFRGRPVFTYYEDKKPGDAWGDQVGGLWGSRFSQLDVPGYNRE